MNQNTQQTAHILVVEDEAHIAQMIEATLQLGGYTCENCADARILHSSAWKCARALTRAN